MSINANKVEIEIDSSKKAEVEKILEKLRAIPGVVVSDHVIIGEATPEVKELMDELKKLQDVTETDVEVTCTNPLCPEHGPRISVNHVILGSLLHLATNDPQRLVKPDAAVQELLELVREQTYDRFMEIRAQLGENGTMH